MINHICIWSFNCLYCTNAEILSAGLVIALTYSSERCLEKPVSSLHSSVHLSLSLRVGGSHGVWWKVIWVRRHLSLMFSARLTGCFQAQPGGTGLRLGPSVFNLWGSGTGTPLAPTAQQHATLLHNIQHTHGKSQDQSSFCSLNIRFRGLTPANLTACTFWVSFLHWSP